MGKDNSKTRGIGMEEMSMMMAKPRLDHEAYGAVHRASLSFFVEAPMKRIALQI
jgi:hypothetical protein